MKTILTAHQPLYLPWLGFFHKIAISDIYVLMDDVQFITDDFIHRNKIKTSTGWTWLTVPILSNNHLNKKIQDMQIDNHINWANKHWKSIFFNYKKSPYFESYSDFFKNVYNKKWNNIVDIDIYILEYLFKELGINIDIVKSSDQKYKGYKSLRIIEMCNMFDANIFIFGALGKNYADLELFKKAGIKTYFQEYKHPFYPQLYGDFISNLSVIDLLFNCGEKSYDILISENPTHNDIIKMMEVL